MEVVPQNGVMLAKFRGGKRWYKTVARETRSDYENAVGEARADTLAQADAELGREICFAVDLGGSGVLDAEAIG
jgi:hypothetical protein